MIDMDDDESFEVQQAIDDSIREREAAMFKSLIEDDPAKKDQSSDPATTDGPETEVPKMTLPWAKEQEPRRINIDDRIKELTLQPAPELPLVNDPCGDTWVYIDPPPKQPEQDDWNYARYAKRYETPMQVKKEMLLRYQSPTDNTSVNLGQLFGPSAQYRIARRRNLIATLRENPRVKYVIDLTPPSEGEDAVFFTTELCCSQSVRLWYQSGTIWRVSNMLVGGHEEYTSVDRRNLVSILKLWQYDSSDTSKLQGPPSPKEATSNKSESASPDVIMPLEYSPVRHRSAIERVICALVGIDPRLDSAPKVWTTFAVSQYLGLSKSPVNDYIVRWLRAYPNSFFLEVCPEASLRIADGLQNHDLARDAFAILVGEEALDSLVRTRKSPCHNPYTVYGRRKEDLPEKILSRIEYASKSLQERISNDFSELAGRKMKWIEDLPEVKFKLLPLTHPVLVQQAKQLMDVLKDYIRGTIYKVLHINYNRLPSADFHHPGGEELIQRSARETVWSELSADERILSRTFWFALKSLSLFAGNSNLDVRSRELLTWNRAIPSVEEKIAIANGTYYEIRLRKLNILIREGERRRVEHKLQPQISLPYRPRLSSNLEPPESITSSMWPERAGDVTEGQMSSVEGPVLQPEISEPIKTPRRFSWESDEYTDELAPDTRQEAHTRGDSGATLPQQWQSGTIIPNGWWDPPPKSDPDTEAKNTSASFIPARTTFFNLEEFFIQASEFLVAKARQKLQPADHLFREEPNDVGITNTLVCLEDSEWKYLPLWAGGNDDDTGGVFNDQLPTADLGLGFSTCGPEIHTGITPANSDKTVSEFEMVDSQSGTETAGTSMINHRSSASTMNRKRVYAADSVDSSSGEDFEFLGTNESAVEQDARKETEAQERLEAAEEEAARAAKRIERYKAGTVDENYADLFNDDNDEDEDGNDTDHADDGDEIMDDGFEENDMVMI